MRPPVFVICSLLLTVWAFAGEPLPPAKLAPAQEITLLITLVENSGATFHRNGSAHDAQSGADHLRLKLRRGARYAQTTEDFIANLATKSSWSGRLYEIELPDGTRQPLGVWLTEQLHALRTTAG